MTYDVMELTLLPIQKLVFRLLKVFWLIVIFLNSHKRLLCSKMFVGDVSIMESPHSIESLTVIYTNKIFRCQYGLFSFIFGVLAPLNLLTRHTKIEKEYKDPNNQGGDVVSLRGREREKQHHFFIFLYFVSHNSCALLIVLCHDVCSRVTAEGLLETSKYESNK